MHTSRTGTLVALAVAIVGASAALHTGHARAHTDGVDDREPPRHLATLLEFGRGITAVPGNVDSDANAIMADVRNHDFDKALESALKMTRANPNDPRAYNLLGAAYIGKKDLANARQSFEKALSIRPDYIPALMNLAQLDLEAKDPASARKRYQAVLDKDQKNVAAMMAIAKLEAASHNDKEGLAWLEKAKAADAKAMAPRFFLGRYYLRNGESAKALSELTEAKALQPNNADVLDLLAQAQIANGRKAEAISTYRTLVSTHPQLPVAQYRLGLAQINNEDFLGARESLKKAVELKPDYGDAVIALAGAEMRSGRPAEALRWAKELQKVAPKSPAGLVLEGDLLVNQGRNADAVKAYQKALGIQSNGLIAVKLHAAQVGTGKAQEADAKLQQWLKDHPEDIAARQYLAGESLKAGRDKDAIEQYQQVLQKDGNNVIALNNLANLYQRGKDPRALDLAERAYKLMPQSPVTADTLGWMLVEQGDTARGLELMQKAAATDPKNVEVRYHLAVALFKAGDKANARRELQDLLRTREDFPNREAATALLKQL
jgi:putative PEP-CTERM system TPR-repeat lipoprotein